MSVEAQHLVGEDWTRWQGHLVDGEFPLGRFLGCSAHSGVFLTKSAATHHGQAALKLLPASRAQQELQLPRWQRASGLVHPHLLPLLKWGACQLDGLPYLYVLMDFADQTLAQLLQRRALTGEEAREMLVPMLEALAYLHGQGLVHSELKPTNVLVVGNQLRLAGDTICRIGEDALVASARDAQQNRLEGPNSTEGDIRGIGRTLYEALTRRSPAGPAGYRRSASLPEDFPPDFRDVVSRCLSPVPQERPSVTAMLDWAAGRHSPGTPVDSIEVATLDVAESTTLHEAASLPAASPVQPAPQATLPSTPRSLSLKPQALAALLIAAAILVGGSIHVLKGSRTGALPVSASTEPVAPTRLANVPSVAPPGPDVHAASKASNGADTTQIVVLREVIHAVSKSASRTLHGHVEVSVRATVRPDGSVSSVAMDRSAQSRYFQRLALQAAKKWAFQPTPAATTRRMEIKFTFGRDGTVGHATALP